MTDHSKYIGPDPDIDPVVTDPGMWLDAAKEAIGEANLAKDVIATSILAAGIGIARAIYQLDATIRRRG